MVNSLKTYGSDLGGDIELVFDSTGLSLGIMELEGQYSKVMLTPEIAREMKSVIDLYLYSLYVKEANIQMVTKKSPVEERREHLKRYMDEAIKGGFRTFHPEPGQFNAFDVELVQEYCHSLGVEVSFDGTKSFIMNPYKPKKVEEDWAKDLEGPKRHWFVVWINKLLYRINR